MPYLHCSKCDHEFEAIKTPELCDWCGSKTYVLENKTPFEQFVESDLDKILTKLKQKGR